MLRRAQPFVAAATAAAAALALAPFVAVVAQDTTPTTPTTPAGPPATSGRDRATAAVGQQGEIFELSNGAKLLIPPSLPIGNSRVLTFASSRQRPRGPQVASGFVLQGPTLTFDGAINATSNPVVVSLRARRLAMRSSMRLVLAMQQAGICTAQNNIHLPNGLCSTWELVDATYDQTTSLIQASVATPGGFRLQFGWVPRPPAAPSEPPPI